MFELNLSDLNVLSRLKASHPASDDLYIGESVDVRAHCDREV